MPSRQDIISRPSSGKSRPSRPASALSRRSSGGFSGEFPGDFDARICMEKRRHLRRAHPNWLDIPNWFFYEVVFGKNRWVLGMGAGLSCGNPCGFWVGSFLFVFLLKVNLKFTRNSDFLALAGKNSRFSKTRTITPHTSFRLLSRQTLLCCVRQLNKHMLVIIAVRPLACMQILGG